MEDWTIEQFKRLTSNWDDSIEMYYPQHLINWRVPERHYRCLYDDWNMLDAVKFIDWNKYFSAHGTTILDLGGGTGWLSSYLSSINKVERVYLVDSNQFFLEYMFPELVKLMGGRREKIFQIKGLFTPLLFEDASLDMVVASSALHHAENLEAVLNEIYRVLKVNGKLFVLNETPYPNYRYLALLGKEFLLLLTNVMLNRYRSKSVSLSSSCCLYDPFLGDRYYPLWYWEKAIKNSHFKLSEVIQTPYLSRKCDKTGVRLTHFICTKVI